MTHYLCILNTELCCDSSAFACSPWLHEVDSSLALGNFCLALQAMSAWYACYSCILGILDLDKYKNMS